MSSQYNLSLTVEVTESAGEIISAVSVVKHVTNSNASFELAVPIPHGLDFSKPFYLYVPSVHLYDDVPQANKSHHAVYRKSLVRGCITVFQNTSSFDEKSSAQLSAKMMEVKIRDLNVATVYSSEGMAGVVTSKSKNKHESKLAQKCADAPDGASDIYKCQIYPDSGINSDATDVGAVEKIYRSTYFLYRIRDLPHLVTKIIHPFGTTDPSRLDHYTSELAWEPIFSLLLTIPSKRLAVEECLKLQQEIEKVKALDAAILPHTNGLGDFGVELSNKCYFKLKNLENQLGDEGVKILSGK